ncbi:uncharacterized protein LOC100278211 [Zea mays]|uniref:Arf-GAP domain-containing protein n=1 Tax=Zea mays TaxID=4577 RepID=B6U5A5_MAIZE|nr:uncharacterized protein LOC100278211 [Zea mays]ACG44538.1 hypothetical protein [Zea mays]|eukprot:NP_001145032.1 uncharacterized protein LOC100278211 [Zea mays]
MIKSDNRICADCGAPDPKWVSANIGVFLCLKCGDVHRALGPDISKVDDYSMVSFIPLDLRKESSIQYVLSSIDTCIQYGEDADVKVRDFEEDED